MQAKPVTEAWVPKTVIPDDFKSSRVYITPEALEKMQAYINLAKGEISGLGNVEALGERDFLITDVFIFRQETAGDHTAFDMDMFFDLMIEAEEKGQDRSKIHLWWHSHPTFNAFWSPEDEETADGVFVNCGWMISIVGNRKGEYLTRLDVFEPLRLTADGLELRALKVSDSLLTEAVRAEIEEKVTYTKTPVAKAYLPVVVQQPVEPAGEVEEQ